MPENAVRTVVTFRSDAFNTTEPRKHFINECCFGDDVAKWLAEELRARGVEAEEPGQEDFGWSLNFSPAAGPHTLVLGYRPGEDVTPPASGSVPWSGTAGSWPPSLAGGTRTCGRKLRR